MGFFDLFRQDKKQPQQKAPARAEPKPAEPGLEIYNGTRVEVATMDDQLIFVAKIVNIHGSDAELHQYSEMIFQIPLEIEDYHVKIRGYLDKEEKAVYLEGLINASASNQWSVKHLTLIKIGNSRAFFRLDTDLEAVIHPTTNKRGAMAEPCRLVNISVGGACIASRVKFERGDRFLLKVSLVSEWETSQLFCRVLRVVDKGEGVFEYGCKFIEMNENDQEKLTKNIFDLQRKRNFSKTQN